MITLLLIFAAVTAAEFGFLVFLLLGQTHQAWIAMDQWIHCLCYDDGMADETFSARCWREHIRAEDPAKRTKWTRRVTWINVVFDDSDHCKNAYEAELERSQEPAEYRAAALSVNAIFDEAAKRG